MNCCTHGGVFVFGSNLAGRHGLGAALHAKHHHGAQRGICIGRCGQSYAIPTKGWEMETLPLVEIATYVKDFILYAERHPETKFFVTRIGCGLAGYADYQIAPMFADAPSNCTLPEEWRTV